MFMELILHKLPTLLVLMVACCLLSVTWPEVLGAIADPAGLADALRIAVGRVLFPDTIVRVVPYIG